MPDDDTLAPRIVALEMRIAYQDEIIEDLNKIVVEQWRQIDLLSQRVARLGDRLEAIKDGAGADPRSEPPPPHY